MADKTSSDKRVATPVEEKLLKLRRLAKKLTRALGMIVEGVGVLLRYTADALCSLGQVMQRK